jgi:hypothetical protein
MAPTPLAGPAQPVRRTVAPGGASQAESVQTGATSAPATSPEGQAGEGGPDLDELAERVFRKLRDRLRVERERLGGTRIR